MADVTDATFQQLVLDRSMEVPVVIDLWATWCGPCKTLGPILENVIAETNGRVELAKVDVDANPRVAQAFGVQSIPAVYAMREQRIVDEFLGAQPEAVVREFVQRLIPSEEETEVGRLLAAGDEDSLRRALELDGDDERVVVALAEVLVADGRGEEACELLERIPETAEVRRLRALARTGGGVGPEEVFSELDSLLGRVKSDDEARQRFVDLLEVAGDDPRVTDYRRKLMTALY